MDRALHEPSGTACRLAIGDRVLDLGLEVLQDAAGCRVELRPQAYRVLRHLAQSPGRIVDKAELLAAVWPGVVVTDDSLVQAIGDVRRGLGDAGHELLKTVPRRGYVLVSDAVHLLLAADASQAERPPQTSARRHGRLLVASVLAAALSLLLVASWWQARQAAPDDSVSDRPSIAVLPFTGAEQDADGARLGSGIAEDLVAELARSSAHRVVSYQSSARFAVDATPVGEIGRRLGSRYLVAGTLSRDGEQLRIVAQLLDSADGHVVWSLTEQLQGEQLPALRRALVGRIAGTLQTRVRRSEERLALRQPPKTLDVMVLLEHGKAAMHRYDAPGLREARRYYDQALAIDPGYANAWIFLGIANTVDVGLNLTGEWPSARLPEVIAQIRRAIELDPESAGAWTALSQAQALAGDFDAATASAQRCFVVSPNDAECFYILGKAQLETGDTEPAERNLAEALERNPLPPSYLPAFQATALWANRRYTEALRAAEQCLAAAPRFWRCRQDRIAALVESGRVAQARDEASRLMAEVPDMSATRFGTVFAERAAELRARRSAAARLAGIAAE